MDPRLFTEWLVIALFCGSVACWLLKLDDTLPLIIGAGAFGLWIEPWLTVDIGPLIFDHSVLSCLAGAVGAAFMIGILQSMVEMIRD